jgi:hypothetical protein
MPAVNNHMTPECPQCNQEIRWNWNMDTFWLVQKEKFATTEEFKTGMNEIEIHSCSCGQVLALIVPTMSGNDIINHKSLKDVDWNHWAHDSL